LDDILTPDFVSSKNNFFRFSEEWVSISDILPPQQEGALAHAANAMLTVISWYIDGRILSNNFPEGSVMDILANILPVPLYLMRLPEI
jgi:hypothetical protein